MRFQPSRFAKPDELAEQKLIDESRYRARFRGMKLAVLGKQTVVRCELDMELRPVRARPGLFQIFYVHTGRPAGKRELTLQQAKEKCRGLFADQLTEWAHVPLGEV